MCPGNNECAGSDGTGNSTDDSGGPSLDTCLELLANRQRRIVLEYFLNADTDHASADELVSKIIEEEARITGEKPGHDSVKGTLFHVHLPKFAEAGVLEYDTRHLEIRYHGHPRVEDVYETIEELQ